MLKRPPQRVSFRGREEIIDLPNLIEIQIKSYDQFLQADKLPHERENVGLQEVFAEIFPIKSYDEKTILEFFAEIVIPAHLVARFPVHEIVLQYSAHVFS